MPGVGAGRANYDTGGQGVAYNVTSINGTANSYRSDGIDLETTSDTQDTSGGGAYDLGWTSQGQWFRYTVNVAAAGATPSVSASPPPTPSPTPCTCPTRPARPDRERQHPRHRRLAELDHRHRHRHLAAGQHTLAVDQDNGGWNLHYISFGTATSTGPGEAPYGGTAAAVPGTVQAANYDTGGQGVAYNVTSVNGTANSYRSDGVDLETCTDTGCGYDIGWTAAGQWFKYTVNVATAATYTVSLRLASPSGVTDGLHIASSSGANLSGEHQRPGHRRLADLGHRHGERPCPPAQQTLTIDQDNGGWNIHDMSFASNSTTTGINTSAWYEVVNQNSGLCASAAGGGPANGTAVQQLACTGATSQLWQFVPVASGEYEVLNDNAQSAAKAGTSPAACRPPPAGTCCRSGHTAAPATPTRCSPPPSSPTAPTTSSLTTQACASTPLGPPPPAGCSCSSTPATAPAPRHSTWSRHRKR